MTFKEKIESLARHTVGYAEAKNKTSFSVGVSVAFDKCEEHYEREITILKNQVDQYKIAIESLESDLYTLSRIINRYSDKN